MIAAWNYTQVCRQLGDAFRYRYPDGEVASIRMVGLLFAPKEVRLARDEIIPSLDYFHHRAGNHIDFFCAGYSRYRYRTQVARSPTPGCSRQAPPLMPSVSLGRTADHGPLTTNH